MCIRSTTGWIYHRVRRLSLKTLDPGEAHIHRSSRDASNRLSLPMVSSKSSIIDWFRRDSNLSQTMHQQFHSIQDYGLEFTGDQS